MNSSLIVLGIFCFSPIAGISQTYVPGHWVGTWAAAPMACPVKAGSPSPGDSTYRNILRISLGGKQLRVQLTNEFGDSQLRIDAAHIALDSGAGAIRSGTDRILGFGGRTSVTIPAGGFVLSDAVALDVPALSSLAISVHVADQAVATRTCHLLASSTNYITKGDATAHPTLQNARTTGSWNFVKGIEVRSVASSFAVVALGDSVTDGNSSTKDANHRWTDYLAQNLQENRDTSRVSVLNEGIIGNRLLHAELGENALARFDRDVLAQAGVRWVVIMEGINDINWSTPSEDATAEELIFAISQLVERAHAHGIAVFAATLLPYGGADGFSAQGDLARTKLNEWYRSAGVVDEVFDFDQALRDPARQNTLNPRYDSGDHLHPNDAGYELMANSVDLRVFRRAGGKHAVHD